MAKLTVHGVQLHYLDTGSGAPIVFVHGNLASTRWWLPTIERLPHGFRAVAFDMRGYGLSDKPGHGYALSERVDEVVELLKQLDLDRVHLVGHSLGAAVALQFALDHPAALRSLTLLAAPSVTGVTVPRSLEAAIPTMLGSRSLFVQALRPSAASGPFGDTWERLVDDGFVTDRQAWLAAGRALRGWKVEQQVQRITTPTQVVHGAADVLVAVADAEQTASLMGDAQLVIIPGAGHSPHVERPAEWAALLVAFLRQHS